VEVAIAGDVEDGYGAVADAFRRNFAERKEVGAAVAVYRDGRKVVDLWGGHRDHDRALPWEAATLVPVFSTTKGMSAVAMAVAHSRGLFDLDAPVATYWPEFAQNGKEGITVRALLGHRGGLAVIDVQLQLSDIADQDRLGQLLAAQSPRGAPGAVQGYHAQSLGWYEGQLLRRVDPEQRSIGRFFAEEVAAPLGIDFYIGLPDDVTTDRLATVRGASRLTAALHARQMPRALLVSMLNPRSVTARAFSNPKVLAMDPSRVNRRDVLRIEFPSMNGVGTARGIAKTYGCMATGGDELALRADTVAELERTTPPSFDEVFRLESAFTCGFMKPFPLLPFGSSPRSYGHTGLGGSFGFADPDAGLGYAYAMNRGGSSLPTDPRELALRTALYATLR
jgi:CubicO group peptidase (beta-lactamase class C family)